MTTQNCPVHNVPFRFVPPGVSKKTGKPYQGFYVCSVDGCEERPQRIQAVAPKPIYVPEPKVKPVDWDKKDWQIGIQGLIQADRAVGVNWDTIKTNIRKGVYSQILDEIKLEASVKVEGKRKAEEVGIAGSPSEDDAPPWEDEDIEVEKIN